MAKRIQVLTQQQYQALLTGLPKYCPNATFVYEEKNYTTPQVVTLISSVLSATSAVPTAKAAATRAVTTANAKESSDGQVVKGVREIVALMFKNADDVLAALEITPKKSPKSLSVEAKAAAAAKAEATRKARGTTGKKQKAAIVGDVTGVTITPITGSSVTAAATGAPVPAAGAAAATSGASAPAAASGAHS
jgi:hypothetical protein